MGVLHELVKLKSAKQGAVSFTSSLQASGLAVEMQGPCQWEGTWRPASLPPPLARL